MLSLSTALLTIALVGAQSSGCPMMSGGSGMNMQGMSGMMTGNMMGIMPVTRMLRDPHMGEMLGLTDVQKSKLETLRYSHQDKMLEMKQKLEREELALTRLMESDTPDKAQIEAKIKTIGSLSTDIELEKIRLFFEIRSILTAEQLDRLEDMTMGGCMQNQDQSQGQDMPGMHH